MTDGNEPAGYHAIDPDCTGAEFLATARVYARRVVEEHDLSVDVTGLDWSISKRAKRRAGAVEYVDGEPRSVVLTWTHFETNGWLETAAVIRHELVHVHLLNEADDGSHGDAFRRLAGKLDTHLHCERFTDPSWWVTCVDCGTRLARYRRSRLVTHPEQYQCGDCGGALVVERNTD